MEEKKRPPVWLWAIVTVVLLGCGSVMVNSFFRIQEAKARMQVSNDVKAVGAAYHQFQDANSRPPRSFDELAKFSQEKGNALTTGAANVTVIWGAGVGNLNKDGPPGEVVLGHAPALDGKDVVVLYVDGSVKQETAETFSHAKKATPLPTR
jgi:hypothetical protein